MGRSVSRRSRWAAGRRARGRDLSNKCALVCARSGYHARLFGLGFALTRICAMEDVPQVWTHARKAVRVQHACSDSIGLRFGSSLVCVLPVVIHLGEGEQDHRPAGLSDGPGLTERARC